MFRCVKCGKPAALIVNVCKECNPELHKAWEGAVKSSVDYDTVTPEMVTAYCLMEKEKKELEKKQ